MEAPMFKKLLFVVYLISILFLTSFIWGCGKPAEETKEMKPQEEVTAEPDTVMIDTSAVDTSQAEEM
jgi:hypothetical protein